MRFMRKTHMKIVSASGAITLLCPWNASRTDVSTKPMISSTAACSLVGFPEVASAAVGAVAELGDGLFDACRQSVAHAALAVDDPRGRLETGVGLVGDVAERRTPQCIAPSHDMIVACPDNVINQTY